MTSCPVCGDAARLLIGVGVNISAHATPTKGGAVIEADEREGRWNKDMPAYKRMRKKGLHPRQIDGAAMVEDRVHDQVDIDRERLAHMPEGAVSRDRFLEAQEQAQELKFQALDEAG